MLKGILNSILAIVHSIFALSKDVVEAVIGLVTSLIGFLLKNIVSFQASFLTRVSDLEGN